MNIFKKKFVSVPIAFVLILVMGVSAVSAAVNAVTPSTNDINKANGWAHFNVLDVGPGEVTIEFVSTREFWSCFEYRSDGDTSQMIGPNNYNTDITDGLYPYVCAKNESKIKTLSANEYVEIRMVFGAETDERFDWTRIDVLPAAPSNNWVYTGRWVYTYRGATAFRWCNLVSVDKDAARFSNPDYVTYACNKTPSVYGPFELAQKAGDYLLSREKKLANGDLTGGNHYYDASH